MLVFPSKSHHHAYQSKGLKFSFLPLIFFFCLRYHMSTYHCNVSLLFNQQRQKRVQMSLCLMKHHTIQTYRVEVQLHAFLTSILDGGEWSTLRMTALPPDKSHQHPLDRWLGGPQSQFGCSSEKKKILFLSPASNQHPVIQPTTWSL